MMKAGRHLWSRCSRSLTLILAIGILIGTTTYATPGMVQAQPQVAPQPVDLMFVIDNSGSMRKNDPDHTTPEVVKRFIHSLPSQARVGMVLFDSQARLLEPLAEIASPQAQEQFVTSLDKFDYRGQYTNSAVGIERALYELKSNGRPEAQRGIIFITDGIIDTGSATKDVELTQWLKQDLTAESKAQSVRIFGIAFTEAADYALIQALAARTDGEYYRTYDASAISQVLDDILVTLQPPPAAPEPEPGTATTRSVEAVAPLPTLAQTTPEANLPAVATPETVPDKAGEGNGMQMLFVILAVIVTVLAAVLVFFYLKQVATVKKEIPPPVVPDDMPEAYLADLSSDGGQTIKELKIDKKRMTIGRDQRNDIVIEKPTISSFHATIEYKNMIFYIEDQRSTNGTKLNDRKLQPNMPMRLKSGDLVRFSTFSFKFIIPDQIAFGETVMVSMTPLEGSESGSTVVLDLNDEGGEQSLISCMQSHLMQLYALGPKYQAFTKKFLAYDTLEIIATKAHENLKKTETDDQQYCVSLAKQKAFYLVCSLPVPISGAARWYEENYGGFTKFIMRWAQSQSFIKAQCDTLCVFTFGQDPATWVSLTIVPTHEERDPVEIMSVDFLTDEEKAMLALDFDHHGRVM